jgi:hypothetical protein
MCVRDAFVVSSVTASWYTLAHLDHRRHRHRGASTCMSPHCWISRPPKVASSEDGEHGDSKTRDRQWWKQLQRGKSGGSQWRRVAAPLELGWHHRHCQMDTTERALCSAGTATRGQPVAWRCRSIRGRITPRHRWMSARAGAAHLRRPRVSFPPIQLIDVRRAGRTAGDGELARVLETSSLCRGRRPRAQRGNYPLTESLLTESFLLQSTMWSTAPSLELVERAPPHGRWPPDARECAAARC